MQKFRLVIDLESYSHCEVSGLANIVGDLLKSEQGQSAINGYLRAVGDRLKITGDVTYSRNDADSLIQTGRNLVEKEYMDDVRGVADEFVQMAKDGDFADEDEAQTWLHETIDGHRRVFITAKAQECLAISTNDDAYIERFGSLEGAVSDDSINWAALAFCAFEADVLAQIDAHDIDPSDPDTWNDGDDDEENEIDPSEGAYTADELRDLDTISQGQTCDLKLDDGDHRVWLSRCSVADGEPFDDAITVEALQDGRWVEVCKYEG